MLALLGADHINPSLVDLSDKDARAAKGTRSKFIKAKIVNMTGLELPTSSGIMDPVRHPFATNHVKKTSSHEMALVFMTLGSMRIFEVGKLS